MWDWVKTKQEQLRLPRQELVRKWQEQKERAKERRNEKDCERRNSLRALDNRAYLWGASAIPIGLQSIDTGEWRIEWIIGMKECVSKEWRRGEKVRKERVGLGRMQIGWIGWMQEEAVTLERASECGEKKTKNRKPKRVYWFWMLIVSENKIKTIRKEWCGILSNKKIQVFVLINSDYDPYPFFFFFFNHQRGRLIRTTVSK